MSEPKLKMTHVRMFETLASNPDATKSLEKSLLILCTPRCGSTLFTEVLNSTGRLGFCDEWFNYDYFRAWEAVTGLDFELQPYMNWVMKKTLGNTGVLCIKWHIGQLVAMNDDHNLGIESMDFDHVIYLYRKDKIAQAVSMAKAVASDQFRCYEEAPEDPPEIKRQNIAEALFTIIKFDRFTREYLMRYVDVSYAYEDFQHFRATSIYNKTLEIFGKPPMAPSELHTRGLKKQRDDQSRWLAGDFIQHITGAIQ